MLTDMTTFLSPQDSDCQLIGAAYYHPDPNCATVGRSVRGWGNLKVKKNTPAMGQELKPTDQF